MKKFIFVLLFISAQSCKEQLPANEIQASGTIEATDVTVSSKVAGQIIDILIREGDKVKKDETLLTIDHESLDIQLRQAQAGVEQAQAQLNLLLAGAKKEDISIAQQQVKVAEVNFEQANSDKERVTNLYNSNVATKQQYEDALTRYDQAVNQYNISLETLKKVKTPVRPQEIESARANIKRNIASVDLIQNTIDECTIKSPVDGIVSKKFIEIGEYITPGGALLNLSDLQTVKLVIYVTEEELGKVKLGQKANIKIDTYKDKVYSGEVIFISTEAEFTPKNIQTQEERTKLVFAVKIEIPNPDYDLKSGMPADAKLVLN